MAVSHPGQRTMVGRPGPGCRRCFRPFRRAASASRISSGKAAPTWVASVEVWQWGHVYEKYSACFMLSILNHCGYLISTNIRLAKIAVMVPVPEAPLSNQAHAQLPILTVSPNGASPARLGDPQHRVVGSLGKRVAAEVRQVDETFRLDAVLLHPFEWRHEIRSSTAV